MRRQRKHKHVKKIHGREKNTQIDLEMKTTMSEIELCWMGLTSDKSLQKKR